MLASVFGDFLKLKWLILVNNYYGWSFVSFWEKTAAETVTMCKKACKDEAMGKTQV